MEFEAKMTAGILFRFLLRQNYRSISGWAGLFLGFGMIAFYFYNGNILLIGLGVFTLVYPPWSFFIKSKKQMLLNPAFKNPLHYQIDDEGIKVSQGDALDVVKWEELFKVVFTKQNIIIHTSPMNAWILPLADLGDHAGKLTEMIQAKMPAAKSVKRFSKIPSNGSASKKI